MSNVFCTFNKISSFNLPKLPINIGITNDIQHNLNFNTEETQINTFDMTLIYNQPLFRPPSEADNLIIQATLGCSFNQCSFCSMYKQKNYSARPLSDVLNDIDNAALAWPDASRVFLADGDALTLPTNTLLAILNALQERLPKLTRISCYATPANILHKTENELDQLKAHKLNLLYLGIESGSDKILKKITKGASQRSINEAMIKAHQSGLKVSGTVILGLGGHTHWQEHINGTIELINSAPLTYLYTLQLFLHETAVEEFNTKFAEVFIKQDDTAILYEQQQLLQGLNPPQAIIFRSNHASNALALAGNLPRDKVRLLTEIEDALNGVRQLRPESMRGL